MWILELFEFVILAILVSDYAKIVTRGLAYTFGYALGAVFLNNFVTLAVTVGIFVFVVGARIAIYLKNNDVQ